MERTPESVECEMALREVCIETIEAHLGTMYSLCELNTGDLVRILNYIEEYR